MSAIRCYLKTPGIPDSVPIHVEENGWPTGPNRPEAYQATVAETLIRAVHDFRGTFNVTDYRWFNLRDGNSQSGNYQTQYGLLRDDYSEKPAFGVVARLFAELGRRDDAVEQPPVHVDAVPIRRRHARLALRVRCRGTRVQARVMGTRAIRHVTFRRGKHRRRDATRPYRVRLAGRGRRVVARVVRSDGTRVTLRRRAPRCR
jgi:hypothetical protein